MSQEAWIELIKIIAPIIADIAIIVGGLFYILRVFKKNDQNREQEFNQTNEKMKKAYEDIAKMQAQLKSINEHLIKQKEKRR